MQQRYYELDALGRERYCAHDKHSDLERADERHRIKTWRELRSITNHLPPQEDKHFLSLNLDDEQVAVILAAVAATRRDAEAGLAQICREWLTRPLAI